MAKIALSPNQSTKMAEISVSVSSKDQSTGTIGEEIIKFYTDEGIRPYVVEAAANHAVWRGLGERGFEEILVKVLGAGAGTVLNVIAKRWNIPFVDKLPPPVDLITGLESSEKFKKDNFIKIYDGHYVPIAFEDNKLMLACSSRAYIDKGVNDLLRLRLVSPDVEVQPVLATRSLITSAYHRYFSDGSKELAEALRKMEKAFFEKKELSDFDIAEAVVFLFARAAFAGASDAMIFVTETVALYKLKVSGVALLAAETTPEVLSAILRVLVNVFAGENDSILNERPQETLIDFNDNLGGENLDRRARVMLEKARSLLGAYRFRLQLAKPQPRTSDGVYAVFRVLNKEASNASLSKLGYGRSVNLMKTAVGRREGLILFVGSTGSGKTTGADALVGEIDPIRRWVYTVENPIEFQHPLYTQHEVRGGSAEYLEIIKSFLRSSPDVCFFGETREAMVAERLCELALTGSLVVSTLHSPDAVSAIQRLRAWGIDNDTISETLNLVVGQRLFPKICPHCSLTVEGETSREIGNIIQALRPDLREAILAGAELKTARTEGCARCFNTGYSGQWLTYEVLPVPLELRAKISAGESPDKMKSFIIRGEDMHTGIAKGVANGILDIIEALPELSGA